MPYNMFLKSKHDAVTFIDQDVTQTSDGAKKTGRRGSTIPKSVMGTSIVVTRDLIGGRIVSGGWRPGEAGEMRETRQREIQGHRLHFVCSSLRSVFDHTE